MNAKRWPRYAVPAAIVVVLWAIGNGVLPRGLPLGIVLQGAVFGSLYALVALGIVLVYWANRVVNFAQAEFGGVAAVVAIELVLQLHLNYFVAIATGLAIGIASGGVVEYAILRRFRNAPRLIVMVVTIGLAQVFTGFAILIPLLWQGQAAGRFTTPFSMHFSLFPVVFDGNYVLAMIAVPAVVIGLGAFLRYTHYGVAIRAAADNGDRAELLGIPVKRVSTIVWGIAGFMSALAVLLRVPILGFASFTDVSGGGPGLLLRALAAAVIGGMTDLPTTAVAAVGIGIAESLAVWTFSNAAYVDGVLLVVVLVVLLLRRERFSRALETGIGTFRAIREVRPVPSELRSLPEVKYGSWGLQALVIAFAVALPLMLRPSQQQLAALILIYAIVAVSLVVLTGWSGQISLGHFALVGFGGAATGVLLANHGVDLFLAIPAGAVVGGIVAMLVGLPALRIRGPYLAVTTLAFAVSSASLFLNHQFVPWLIPTGDISRPPLWNRVSISTDWQIYYFCLVWLIAVLVLVRGLRRSRTGRAIIAVRDNALAAQSTAISTTKMQLIAFGLSGAIAGLAGGLYVLHQMAFHTDAFAPQESLALFSMVVIGGLGSVPGAVLGAIYIKGAEYLLPPGWAFLASGFGIVLLLLVLPEGLGGFVYRLRDDALRRIASRRHVIVPSLFADVRVEDREVKVTLDAALGGLSREKVDV